MPTNIAVHTISFRGIAGSIFVCLTFSCVFYVIGFATTSWTIDGKHQGLWQECKCNSYGDKEDWFRATQAMITVGLIGVLVALLLACIYMCVHTVSKNTTILALVIVCFVAVLFMVIGFIVFAAKVDNVSWSFGVTVVAGILTLVAGILSIVQMRQAGVRV